MNIYLYSKSEKNLNQKKYCIRYIMNENQKDILNQKKNIPNKKKI